MSSVCDARHPLKVILMGTGTSHGVPVIACDCPVCRSSDPHDKRMRTSAYITQQGADGTLTAVVIDTGPEFRMQALRFCVRKADAVLLTHSHADHLDGLDDVRIFCHTASEGAFSAQGRETPGDALAVYGNATTLTDVKNRFDYIFKPTQLGGGKPKLRLVDTAPYTAENPIRVGSLAIVPVPMMHGTVPTTGYLVSGGGSPFAYLTDLNYISDDGIRTVRDFLSPKGSVLVIDGLRERHHSTHFTFSEALACADKIGASQTYLTHICHSASHEEIKLWIHDNVQQFPRLCRILQDGGALSPAYDGQVIICP